MVACGQCDQSAHPLCIEKFDKTRVNEPDKEYVCHKCRAGTDDEGEDLSAGSVLDEEEEEVSDGEANDTSDESVGHKTSAEEVDTDDEGNVSDNEEEQEDRYPQTRGFLCFMSKSLFSWL